MVRVVALMYLKSISEFTKFLGDQERTIEEVLAHMVLRVMAPLEATSAFIAKLDNQNSILTIGRYGINGDLSRQYEDCFSLSDRLPITDAIRQRKIILVNTLPEWPAEYSDLLDSPYHSEELALIAFPIEKSGTPVAVAAVFLDARLAMDEERELFIQSIAHLLSIYLSQQELAERVTAKKVNGSISISRPQASGDLTQRQLLILRMISEGRTNIAIGDLLKYSESTIRQETIKIFSKLECDGRVEASKLFKSQQLKVQASA